ncbi:hypothetical protein M0Q28_05940 [Patescibacteria group bacterium]|nr:hypothetical protein [Patescibacteria group bacterium]
MADSYQKQFDDLTGLVENARKLGATNEEIWEAIKEKPLVVEALSAVDEKDIRSAFDVYQQNTGPERLPAMLGQNVLKGAASMLGAPGDFEALINGLLGDKGKTGWNTITGTESERPEAGSHWLPTSEETNDFLRGLGLIDSPDLRPQPGGEDWAATGAYGLGAALPIALTGGGMLPNLASGVGGAISAKGASELFPENELAPFLGGLLGGGVIHGSMEKIASMQGAKSTMSELEDALATKAALQGKHLDEKLNFEKMMSDLGGKKAETLAAAEASGKAGIEAAAEKLAAAQVAAGGLISRDLATLGALDKLDIATGKLAEWGKLGAKDKAALVGDPTVRKALDLATSEHASAIEAAKSGLAEAKKSAAAGLAEAKKEMRTRSIEAAKERLTAEQRIGRAKAAVPKVESIGETIGRIKRDVAHGAFGASAAGGLSAAISGLGSGTPLHAAGGAVASIAAPYALNYVKSTLGNPGRLNALMLGVEGADAADNWTK